MQRNCGDDDDGGGGGNDDDDGGGGGDNDEKCGYRKLVAVMHPFKCQCKTVKCTSKLWLDQDQFKYFKIFYKNKTKEKCVLYIF